MEPKIRVDFRFLNQRIAASNDGYKNFVRDLIELHTFPSETWTSISKKEADGISQAVASIPSDIAEMSDRRAREVGHFISQQFHQGRLLWPNGQAADAIRKLKGNSPRTALAEMVSELDKQARSATAEVIKKSPDDSVATLGVVRELIRDELSAARTAESEIKKLEEQRLSVEKERFAKMFETLQSSVANQLAERVVEGEKTRLENQQWFETRKGELDTHAERLDGLSGLLKQNVEDWTREKANELESWRDAFRTSFAVEAAHTYWAKTKFQRHSRIATQLMFVGIGYLVSVLAVLAGIIWMGRASKEPFWQAPVSIALPLALTLIVLIWLGRLLSRSYMAHAQLAEDAQERATFIETYIALIRAGVLDKSDAVEAHKAIFRPASLGLLSGDGATDTPIEVVSKAIAGGGPKT